MNQYLSKIHIPRKRFSQNFLHDKYFIKKIISIINPKKNQNIIEIGPGLGALTELISNFSNNFTVIEIDNNLSLFLKNKFLTNNKINIINKDVMKINFFEIINKSKQRLRIFGNLPYNITTPFLFYLFKYINVIHDMNFVVQKEVADRLISSPNKKTYGRLSIMAQYFCQIFKILEIPMTSFTPQPKINSTMIRLIPCYNNFFDIKLSYNLSLITKTAFSQRRKKILNSLKNFLNIQQLEKFNINPMDRAENITVEQYCNLAKLIN